mmetsp:Transcript_2500/g.4861  ORF Transcript_2500/g.4861 Transcript_2500/m.4861 type:complete len:104 (-) Transcript_2500:535-846(-)
MPSLSLTAYLVWQLADGRMLKCNLLFRFLAKKKISVQKTWDSAPHDVMLTRNQSAWGREVESASHRAISFRSFASHINFCTRLPAVTKAPAESLSEACLGLLC